MAFGILPLKIKQCGDMAAKEVRNKLWGDIFLEFHRY